LLLIPSVMQRILIGFICLLAITTTNGQNVGIGTTTPHSLAALEVRSPNKGFLMPRMGETVRLGMSSVPAGMMVYDNSAGCFFYHDGGKWRKFNEFNADSTLRDFSANPQVTENISFNATTTALSGILYDNGGPTGNYSNDFTVNYRVLIGTDGNDSTVMFKIELLEMDMDSPNDHVDIWTDPAHKLSFSGNEWGTFYLPATASLTIEQVTNSSVTRPGFKIRWTQLLGPKSEQPPFYGWYVDYTRRAARGGINYMNDWAKLIGIGSLGYGMLTQASGKYSFSLGRETIAAGNYAAAIGYKATAAGTASMSLGQFTTSSGDNSIALGYLSSATGDYSIVAGSSSTATGNYSLALGNTNRARGVYSTAIGSGSIAWGYATSIGQFNDTLDGSSSLTSWVQTDPLFVVGNGSGPFARSTAMTILKNGKMGIGVTSPAVKLHVEGGSDASLSAGSGYMVLGPVTGTNVVFDNNEIQARNNGAVTTLYLQNAGGAFEIGGTAAKPGGGSWSATSDARLKKNVEPYTDGLEKIMQVKPVRFNYNNESGYNTEKEYIGVLAQELQTVLPYMVDSFAKKGNTYLSVDNSPMMYLLINAVKEQQAQINALKQEIADMKKTATMPAKKDE
jgi:hypothetical protein